MFDHNPFAALSTAVPPAAMQAYVVSMVALVALGTIYDMVHKQSMTYFFRNWRSAKGRAKRPVGGGAMLLAAIQTAIEGLSSGEFCNTRRRLAHLLTMYGFLLYAVTTAILVFRYPKQATPALLPELWHLGALLVLAGGAWFWFFIRVDVVAEGHSRWRVVRADLFIVALLKSVTLALIWSWLQFIGSAWADVPLALYLIATTVLFASVPWSKFSHMFYKPAAAFQKRIEDANGSRSNLPLPAGKPDVFGSARRHPSQY